MTPDNHFLAETLQQMALEVSVPALQSLQDYVALLMKWNSVYNLTALRDYRAICVHHVLDSLALLPYLEATKTLIDVGSGGGMPGILIAICRPEIAVDLLDANSKKTAFLQQAVIELGLKNVNVITARVEEYNAKTYDLVTGRAFAALPAWVRLSQHLCGKNGQWALLKGVYPQEELAALDDDIEVIAVESVNVPMLNAARHIVLMRTKQGD